MRAKGLKPYGNFGFPRNRKPPNYRDFNLRVSGFCCSGIPLPRLAIGRPAPDFATEFTHEIADFARAGRGLHRGRIFKFPAAEADRAPTYNFKAVDVLRASF